LTRRITKFQWVGVHQHDGLEIQPVKGIAYFLRAGEDNPRKMVMIKQQAQRRIHDPRARPIVGRKVTDFNNFAARNRKGECADKMLSIAVSR
jgi:hypothetical protein